MVIVSPISRATLPFQMAYINGGDPVILTTYPSSWEPILQVVLFGIFQEVTLKWVVTTIFTPFIGRFGITHVS